MARTVKRPKRNQPGGPKRPAASKLRARQKDAWATAIELQTMVIELARLAIDYLEKQKSDPDPTDVEVRHLRHQDEEVLRSVYARVTKHAAKPPTVGAGDVRFTLLTMRLGLVRSELERSLWRWRDKEKVSVDRDEAIAEDVAEMLRRNGITSFTEEQVHRVIRRLREEYLAPDAECSKDWIANDNGPGEAAGLILQALGDENGWLGSSKGNTSRVKKVVETADGDYASRRKSQLKLAAFFLATLGIPVHRIPELAVQVLMAKDGQEFSLRPRDVRPEGVLPDILSEPIPTPFLQRDTETWKQTAENTAKALRGLRESLEAAYPGFNIGVNGTARGNDRAWGRLWLMACNSAVGMPPESGSRGTGVPEPVIPEEPDASPPGVKSQFRGEDKK